MNKLAIGVVFLVNCQFAGAAAWVKVAETSNNTHVFIDVDSFEYSSAQNSIKYWTKGNNYYIPPKNPYLGEKGEVSYKEKIISYCSTKQFQVLRQITYDEDGNVLESRTRSAGLSDIVPDSVSSDIFKRICSKSKNNEPPKLENSKGGIEDYILDLAKYYGVSLPISDGYKELYGDLPDMVNYQTIKDWDGATHAYFKKAGKK